MEDINFKDPVHLKKGINLRDLMSKGTELHIDLDFKKKQNNMFLNADADLFPDMDEDDDSDSGEDNIMKNLEKSAEKMMLSSPEYLSFDDLATKMVDCHPSGDVKILIVEEDDGPLVPMDAEVSIQYAAYWEKASIPFDSTLTMNFGAPMSFRLGEGKVIPGIEIALTTVRGPKALFHLLVQPNMAWGRGVPPRIRPEPALFVVALYSVKDTAAHIRFTELPSEEQSKYTVTKKTVESLHNHAKDLFSRKKYDKSIGSYQQAISVLRLSRTDDENEQDEIKRLKINSYLNLAVCYYKIHKPKYIINMLECLDQIIDVEKHCKALFYYGRAYEMMGKTDNALEYYNKALKLEPKNKDIGKTLAALDKSEIEAAAKEKVLWRKAFNTSPEKNENIVYDVDEDFQHGVRDMCQSLAGSDEYAKVDLPPGLSKDEVACVKALVGQFQGLTIDEDVRGKKKIICIIKKSF